MKKIVVLLSLFALSACTSASDEVALHNSMLASVLNYDKATNELLQETVNYYDGNDSSNLELLTEDVDNLAEEIIVFRRFMENADYSENQQLFKDFYLNNLAEKVDNLEKYLDKLLEAAALDEEARGESEAFQAAVKEYLERDMASRETSDELKDLMDANNEY